ncbi:MAG TPA: HAD family hydrolase [Balneolaceae bacterium]|nr:HAD family hydrolase [Balneolaceae bacterium]
MNKAIFIDKDGTLIEDVPYNVNPSLIELMPGVGESLKLLQDEDYKIVVISNQSGVARGLFEEEKLKGVESELEHQLDAYRVALNGFYYCPHLPEAEGDVEEYTVDCNCRKPKAGLLLKAARELNVDLASSWMIGDILNDVEAGNRAGCKSILFDNGGETEWMLNDQRIPDNIVYQMQEIPEIILQHENVLYE